MNLLHHTHNADHMTLKLKLLRAVRLRTVRGVQSALMKIVYIIEKYRQSMKPQN